MSLVTHDPAERQTPAGPLTVLGIETSCDETAAAVVRGAAGRPSVPLSDIVFSQIEEHRAYGGVVPELAARAHIGRLGPVIEAALGTAGCGWDGLDGIAVTAGPGLIGGVLAGLMTAKGLAAARGLPLVPVNHLEGHLLSPRLAADLPFPYLALLISGGHCQLIAVAGLGRYQVWGSTIDDAAGEAFDKTAKLLELGFPGGPAVERAAQGGAPRRFALPRPLLGRDGMDFSFSGLKTAVLQTAQAEAPLDRQTTADLCASFQAAVADCLADRTRRAMASFADRFPEAQRCLAVVGGVAANQTIGTALARAAAEAGFSLVKPPLKLCTDNGAMIALAGLERLRAGAVPSLDAALAEPARARWPVTDLS